MLCIDVCYVIYSYDNFCEHTRISGNKNRLFTGLLVGAEKVKLLQIE